MDILNIIVGLFMIGMGFLIKSSPNLIAGFNTMSEDQKRNVDIDGLSTYLRNGLIMMGLGIITGYYFFKWIGFSAVAESIIIVVTLLGVLVMVKNAQRFDHNKKKAQQTITTYFILGIATLFVIGIFTYGYFPAKVDISDDMIKMSGMYGIELNVSNIQSIELSDTIPKIKARTNGFSSGEVKKGSFDLDVFGKTRLQIDSDQSPYVILTQNNSKKVILNWRSKSETEKLYTEIKNWIDNY